MLSSTSKGAQRIYDQTQILDVDGKIPKCNILYAGGSETGKEVDLANGCDILIATPVCFLRMMNKYDGLIVNLKRCCHLILDDGERLIGEFGAEVNEIVAEYNKSLQARCKRSLLNQLVVCSSRWTKGIESLLGLLSKLTPLVLFSSFFEAAVYAKVRTFVNYGDPRSKDATLLGECTTLA